MSEVIVKLTSDHIKVKGGEYVRDYQRGEWIPCTKSGLALTELMRREGHKWYGYRCSNCNHIYKGNALTDCNFCQNCGADMREVRDE